MCLFCIFLPDGFTILFYVCVKYLYAIDTMNYVSY